MNSKQVRELQRGMNFFTKKYLKGFSPLLVDGKMGASTKARIRIIKYYLGYDGGVAQQNAKADVNFRSRMWHPKDVRHSSLARVRRGNKRRSTQRANWTKNHSKATRSTGVGTFDGRPVANWLIPYLQWARHVGHNGRKWKGTVNSGWRDPNYSESLCYRMCGRPSCSGMCAGRNSNHSGSVKPRGAVDLSDYWTFAAIIAHCPLRPRIFNNLPRDRVHFSATGN